MSVDAVVRDWFAEQCQTWLDLEDGVLVDAPDAVHQMRVTSRRLRAVMRVWRAAVAGIPAGDLVDELRWVAHALGDARDLEVLEARLVGEASDLPGPGHVSALQAITADLDARRRQAHRELADDLVTDRFADVRQAVLRLGHQVHARRHTELDDLVRLTRDRAERSLDAWDDLDVGGAPLDAEGWAQLHHVRRVAKSARYTAEALGDADDRAPGWASAFKAVASALGAVQDAVVAEEYLWTLASQQIDPVTRQVLDFLSRGEQARRDAALTAAIPVLEAARDATH